MQNFYSRTELLIGADAVEKLKNSRVCIFGVGGVGGFTAEALARAGVGKIDLIDGDTVSESNLNRQIIALKSTVGKSKVEVMRERIADINGDCTVTAHNRFMLPADIEELDLESFDYVVDAIDTVSTKIALAVACDARGIPLISSMGTGNKLDPTRFEVADIYKTSVCPLARVMRAELKRRNVKSLKVVYSREEPKRSVQEQGTDGERRKSTPASISFVPSAAGLVIASAVVQELIK